MKKIKSLVFNLALISFLATNSLAESPSVDLMDQFNLSINQIKNTVFLNDSELIKLASSWGGGAVKTFTSSKYQRAVKVILRSQTSGIASTEVLFFTQARQMKPGWKLVLYYPLVLMETMDIEAKGDGLSIYAYRKEDNLKIERLFISYNTLIGPVIADLQAYPLQDENEYLMKMIKYPLKN